MSSSIQIDKTLLPLNHVIIEEGSAYMIYDNKEEVFYNKVQVLNRDISIQVIKLFSEIYMKERNDKHQKRLLKIAAEQSSISPNHITSSSSSNHNQQQHNEDLIKPIAGIKILDALAATGLRSIRYMKEIPNIRSITINDLSKEATEVASNNIKINNIDENKCIICNKDATILMYESRGQHDQYDVIDIDPYGSASPFLDSAVQAVTDGGLLCITCTDTSVLCGTYPEVCYSKYGSIPLRESYLHEGSLRILLNSIETVANKYKRYIEPWLSLSVDFYIRVFIRIYHSPHEVKLSCLKRIMIYQSLHCPTFYFENLISKKIVNKKLKTSHKHAHKELPKPQNNNDDDDDKTNNCHDDHDYKHNGDAHSNKINRREISNNDFSFMHNKQSTLISNEIMNENGNFQGKVLNITSNCPDCGSKWRIGGPYWGQSMYNQEVIDEILKRVEGSVNIRNESGDSSTTTTTSPTSYTHIPTGPRLAGILASMSEELKDVPMFYLLSELVSTIQTSVTPPYDDVKSAIENAGYRVSRFHHEPLAIKTDAPSTVIWDIMRAWDKIQKKNDSKDKKNAKLSDVAQYILSKENSIVVNFHQTHSKIHRKFARFPPNPEANWGPKRRAGKTKKSSFDNNNNNSNNISKDIKGNDDNVSHHDNGLSLGSTAEVDHYKNDKLTLTSTTTLNCDTNSPSSSPSTKKSKLE